jgi:hypothetical protein
MAEREADEAAEAMLEGRHFALSAYGAGDVQLKKGSKQDKKGPKTEGPIVDEDPMNKLLGPWTAAGVIAVLNTPADSHVLKTIDALGIEIRRFATAFDVWKYNDGRIEEVEVTGLLGHTDRENNAISVRASLSNEEAAATLVHEVGHMAAGEAETKEEALDQEVDVRVAEEDFRSRHRLDEDVTGARRKDGSIDRKVIDKAVKGSQHYNPTNKKKLKRRWVDRVKAKDWIMPPVIF